MAENKILLLDIDGVMSPLGVDEVDLDSLERNSGWSSWSMKHIAGFNMAISQQLISSLKTLAAHKDIIAVWCSTWERESRLFGKDLNLGENWDFLNIAELPRGTSLDKKTLFVQQTLLNNPQSSKAVWVDDGAIPSKKVLDEAFKGVGLYPDGLLTVKPDKRTGLTRKQYESIVRFLK